MGFLTWLTGVLASAGVDIYVMPGAQTRSTWDAGLVVEGIVWHHTGTGPSWQDGHVAALLRDGRRDLSGPLTQVGIERDGTWVIVALGRANHNGYGLWGNDSLGLEFYNAGNGTDPWPAAQVESGIRGITAICRHLGLSPDRVRGHRETDPKRKVDPPAGQIDMNDIRFWVAAGLQSPPVFDGEDIMATDPRGAARLCIREFLGRSPGTYAELDFHAGQIKTLGLNGYIEWLEQQDEAKAWAAKIGAEVKTPDSV